MGALDELDECERKDMAEKGYEEDRFAERDDGGTPKSGKANDTFRIVEKAVDTAVCEFRSLVEEKVAKEPAKLAQRLVDTGNSPSLESDERETNDMSKEDQSVGPVVRQVIHLPSSTDESCVGECHAEMIQTLPLTPGFFCRLAVLDKVTRPLLALGLPV